MCGRTKYVCGPVSLCSQVASPVRTGVVALLMSSPPASGAGTVSALSLWGRPRDAVAYLEELKKNQTKKKGKQSWVIREIVFDL